MNDLNRRRFFAGAVATAAMSVSTPTSAASSAARSERDGGRGNGHGSAIASLENPDNLYRHYRRIRFASDERVFFWWLRGRRFGFVDQLMTPFFTMHVGSMHRCRNLGEGRYEVATASSIYFTDLASGELLETWSNPVTGRSVRFNYPAPRAAISVYSESTGVLSEPGMPGARLERRHEVAPLQVIGPDAWLTEESYLRLHRDADGSSMRVQDMYTFTSPVAALQDPGLRFVPAVEQFNDYNDWSPRFEMGDRPGSSVARCAGRKVDSLAAMPEDWLRLARRLHPDAVRDPARTLG